LFLLNGEASGGNDLGANSSLAFHQGGYLGVDDWGQGVEKNDDLTRFVPPRFFIFDLGDRMRIGDAPLSASW
jgi:hypothetical protein